MTTPATLQLLAWLLQRRQLPACLCLLWLLPAGLASAQTLQALDTLLQQPLRNQIITDDAYAGVLYQKQVALTGLAVQQGKTLGTNVTIGDKSATLNIGFVDIKLQHFLNMALIANGQFNSDQGFVKLFSEENMRITAGYGGTLLLFGHGRSTFSERTKKDFQWKLRELRHQDKLKWGDSLTPYTAAAWKAKHALIMCSFIEAWRDFQAWLEKDPNKDKNSNRAHRFYNENGNFTSIELADAEGQRLYLNYLDAEHAALPLLGKQWDKWNRQDELNFIRQQLGLTLVNPAGAQLSLQDTLDTSNQFALTLEHARQQANQLALDKRHHFYDSLQQQVSWVRKWRSWGSFQFLRNSIEQPVFNAANRAQTYADVYRDTYWRLQASYNGLMEGKTVNLAASLGGGTSNAVVFRKADLLTYQTSAWQPTGMGTDSALVVTQKSLYASIPTRVRYWNVQTQFTGTLNKGLPGFGLTTTYEVLLAHDTHAIHNITLGVIVPLRTDKSTVLFIPQARDRWSFGFTVTATLPTFIVNTFK
jgi:hypothetical protein